MEIIVATLVWNLTYISINLRFALQSCVCIAKVKTMKGHKSRKKANQT